MAQSSRADRSRLAEWWWTVDKSLLAAALALIAAGFFLSLSSSPAATARLKIDNPFHFMERHAVFAVLAAFTLVGVSALSPRWAKRLCLVGLLGTLLILCALPFVGFSAKGSTRWLALGGFLLQPSEFLKPFFVVVTAWLFAEGQRQRDIPTTAIAVGLFALSAALLITQPDFGQTVLLATVWGAMFFLAGISLWIVGALFGFGVAGVFGAYALIPHVTTRIDRFVTGSGDNFQVDRGLQAIESGGWLGRGPGEGLVKRGLPDSHTDFIFSVAAEEYGIIVVMGLVAVFFFIMLRGLFHAMRERERFVQLAVAGLVLQFGLQATINICVNLQLAPAKGMTLPFVSYGGSSMVAVAIGMGLVLALTRRRGESLRRLDVRIGPASNMATA